VQIHGKCCNTHFKRQYRVKFISSHNIYHTESAARRFWWDGMARRDVFIFNEYFVLKMSYTLYEFLQANSESLVIVIQISPTARGCDQYLQNPAHLSYPFLHAALQRDQLCVCYSLQVFISLTLFGAQLRFKILYSA
jgi:uncharacterized protein (DUF486 family)